MTKNKDAIKIRQKIESVKWEELVQRIFISSVKCMKQTVKFSSSSLSPYPFVIEAIYEFAVRFNKDGDNHLDDKTFGEMYEMVFKNPGYMLKKYGTDNFMTLFYLWQIEDRHIFYLRLFRHFWFFSCKNQKVDMEYAFNQKYGCNYRSFEIFCCLIVVGVITVDEADEFSKQRILRIVQKVVETFKNIAIMLSSSREEYVKESIKACPDEDYLIYSLKISKRYPFLKNEDYFYLYMPHTIIPACTSSLLYRLTENDNELHGLFSKEVLEEYYYFLAKQQPCYSYISKELTYGSNKTPDLILIDGEKIFFIEIKAFVPNSGTRILNQKSLEKQIKIIVDDLEQLYRFLFKNYPTNLKPISAFDLKNRYGILSIKGDASFNRGNLYNRLFKQIGINDEETKKQIVEHIKISCLDEYEYLVVTNTSIGKLIDYYNIPGNEMNYTAEKIYKGKTINNLALSKYEKSLKEECERFIKFFALDN